MIERRKTDTKSNSMLEIEFVASLGAELTESIELEQTLRNATLRVMEYLNAETASVFLMNPEGTHLVCRYCSEPIGITGLAVPYGKGIVSRAVMNNSLETVLDARNDKDFNSKVDEETGFVTRSILCAPLAMKGKPFGAIEVCNKKGDNPLFTAKDGGLLSSLAALAAFAIHHARMTAERVAQEALRQEIRLAGEIQRSLLPNDPEPDFPVFGINLPVQEISGDFYSHLVLADGRIAFSLGDVSGKGIRASMLMSKTISLFQCLCKSQPQPARLLTAINNEVYATSSHGMFVSMVVGIYNPATQNVLFANAGHLPPILRKTNGEFTSFDADMPPLGILPDIEFQEEAVDLHGGSLYLYSDGVTESGGEQELGEEGLKGLLDEFARYPLSQRLRAIVERLTSSGQPIHDDITLLAIESTETIPLGVLSFPSDPATLQEMRSRVREMVKSAGTADGLADSIVVALNEACMNVIQHGYQGSNQGDYELRVAHDANRQAMIFELLDHAPPVDQEKVKSRSLEDVRPGGLGVYFIRQLMDEMVFCSPPEGYGNMLYMSIRLDKKNPLEPT